MTPEGRVKKDIREYLDSLGLWRAGTPRPKGQIRGWYYMPVNNGMGVSGIPDFIGSLAIRPHGLPFAIEAKAPGESATERQLDRQEEMEVGGYLIFNDIDDVSKLATLENYLG